MRAVASAVSLRVGIVGRLFLAVARRRSATTPTLPPPPPPPAWVAAYGTLPPAIFKNRTFAFPAEWFLLVRQTRQEYYFRPSSAHKRQEPRNWLRATVYLFYSGSDSPG
jgi:hypothetical protein